MSTCRGVNARGSADDDPPHAVDRGIFVRSMRVSAMPEPGRDPRQMQVLVEGEFRHRPPARGPYFGLLGVGLDRFDRGPSDPGVGVRLRGAIGAFGLDAKLAEPPLLQM